MGQWQCYQFVWVCMQCCRSKTLFFESGSGSYLTIRLGSVSGSGLYTFHFRKIFARLSLYGQIYKIKLIICKNWSYEVKNSVFFTAFLFQEAWSMMIVLDPDQTCQVIRDQDSYPTCSLISDLDLDSDFWFWFLIRTDSDPQHCLYEFL